MRLYVVRKQKTLFWPESLGAEAHRGGEGTVVDADRPCEGMFLDGQMYKLHPAPKGTPVTPIVHRGALDLIAEATGKSWDEVRDEMAGVTRPSRKKSMPAPSNRMVRSSEREKK